MLVLGIGGGLDTDYGSRYLLDRELFHHDAAAVLVEDGQIVAAIEEERLNRIKHTNKAPIAAIRFCLEQRGIRAEHLDRIAWFGKETEADALLTRHRLTFADEGAYPNMRAAIQDMMLQATSSSIDPERITFVEHHLAHAMSAYQLSGFGRSLVVTLDGAGDGLSGMVLSVDGRQVTMLKTLDAGGHRSLGGFYLSLCEFLGYTIFDEYKVMGLAPYGDPAHFRPQFQKLYQLLPNGEYVLHPSMVSSVFPQSLSRGKGKPFEQKHKDIAAGLQEALEQIVLHLLKHLKQRTGHTNLCLAGGVAHNCSMNGKLFYSGMFEGLFIQPAAHDGGGPLGAALYVSALEQPSLPPPARLKQVYWGTNIGSCEEIAATLERWNNLIDVEHRNDPAPDAARLLAAGAVGAWVQGRSEFGPRALGNRSILADPRPAANKDIINAMVKKRETYRPFAPSVLEERAAEFFDVSEATSPDLGFMICVLRVRAEKQAQLGAVTHVDGTARVQTVSRRTNPRYWDVINAFGEITDVPILLNTSFNNNAEPIVDSVEDAIVTFLTTGLHFMVVGNYLVRKPVDRVEAFSTLLANLAPGVPRYGRLYQTRRFDTAGMVTLYEIGNSFSDRLRVPLSPTVYHVLTLADGKRCLGDLLAQDRVDGNQQLQVLEEINSLWAQRAIKLAPVP